MKSDADILTGYHDWESEFASWPVWLLTEVAKGYVAVLAPVKDQLSERERMAFLGVDRILAPHHRHGYCGFTVADVIVLRLAVKTRGLRYRSPMV